MRYEVKVPPTADGALSVKITAWFKQPGETVERGRDLVEMTTEKVTLYASAPASGTLIEILVEKGGQAKVGDTIGVVEGESA